MDLEIVWVVQILDQNDNNTPLRQGLSNTEGPPKFQSEERKLRQKLVHKVSREKPTP